MSISGLYPPHRNPAPGPKFIDKMKWLSGFTEPAKNLLEKGEPVILAGDDKPEPWVDDAP